MDKKITEGKSYCNNKKQIIEVKGNHLIAVANSEKAAEIIVKVLNYYFDVENFTRNESVEMMHTHAASTLKSIADFAEKHEYIGEQVIEYLRELSEEFEAQAIVVSMRDELKFSKPEFK